MMRKVLVTGLGFVTSIGNTKSDVKEHLRDLRHGMQIYPPFQKLNALIHVAAPIQGFETESEDSEDWIFPDRYKIKLDVLRGLAPHALYAYCAMEQALDDAGLNREMISNEGTGLFTASGGSIVRIYQNLKKMYRVGPMRCPPLGIVSSVVGTLNFNLVAAFKIKGSSTGFVSACASSGHAMGYAFEEISSGRQDRIFVVGAEDFNMESIAPFAGMRALSSSKDPDRASRPFDRDRDGFVGTGGAVVMVLENEETAKNRKAPVYAEMLGWGQASDGFHVAASHPEGDGLKRALKIALKRSALQPEQIDYINAHATSTYVGDLAEIRALKSVFSPEKTHPAISSTKALTGHGISLSSVLEAALSIVAAKDGFMPGSAHIENLEIEAAGLNIIRKNKRPAPEIFMSNSSGFGGANVSVVFRKR